METSLTSEHNVQGIELIKAVQDSGRKLKLNKISHSNTAGHNLI